MQKNKLQMNYDAIHKDISSHLRQVPDVCKAGYSALLHAGDPEQLALVMLHYWADVNNALWPVCQQLLASHYADVRGTMRSYGISYNEDADHGYCIADEYATATVRVSGSTQVEAHGTATVEAFGNARVELHDEAKATVGGMCRAMARDRSSVLARGNATVNAGGRSHVVADGAVIVHLSDSATITLHRAFRVYNHNA